MLKNSTTKKNTIFATIGTDSNSIGNATIPATIVPIMPIRRHVELISAHLVSVGLFKDAANAISHVIAINSSTATASIAITDATSAKPGIIIETAADTAAMIIEANTAAIQLNRLVSFIFLTPSGQRIYIEDYHPL